MASLVFEQDDADDQLLAQALYVAEEDIVDEVQERPPATGEEYLKQVVRQAKRLEFATTGKFSM